MTDRILSALIVDDEPLARALLKEMLLDHEDVAVAGECSNGFEAVKAVGALSPDLIFLDIRMPKLDGFEVLELLDTPPAVVFVTAYDEYAMNAFDAHAVDYLLKPYSADRLAAAIEKVRRSTGRAPLPVGELRRAADDRPPDRVVVKDGASVVIIPHDRIDYIRAEDDYVSIHADGRDHLKLGTISGLEEDLDPRRFVRIHRSTILNIERLDRIEPYTKDRHLALLRDGTELNMSRAGHRRLKDLLGN